MNSALKTTAGRFGKAILMLAITAILATGNVGCNEDEEFWTDFNCGLNNPDSWQTVCQ